MELRVASPCSESWDSMEGDERTRFCDRCKLNVYNFSSMTEAEGLELVRKTEGRLCVRFYRRRDGTVLTKDCPAGRAKRLLLRFAGVLSGLFLIVVGSLTSGFTEQPQPARWFGAVVGWVEEELLGKKTTMNTGPTMGIACPPAPPKGAPPPQSPAGTP